MSHHISFERHAYARVCDVMKACQIGICVYEKLRNAKKNHRVDNLRVSDAVGATS